MGHLNVKEVDKVEILTLQDNYVDITVMDNNALITRATPIKAGEIQNSILAEHGFSAIVKTMTGDQTKTMLFDCGFSEDGAAYNAKALDVDMGQVEVIALSHGHSDHMGGLGKLVAMIGKKDIKFVVHPAAFNSPRYLKLGEQLKFHFPKLVMETLEKAGLKVVEAKEPYPILDGNVLFLGEIPRQTDFETGFPIAHFKDKGVEKWDPIVDDTSIVMNLKGKGLIILSGCAHSGIVNTVNYAMDLTGINKIHAIMGGFHLSGPFFEPIIDRTTEELKKIQPAYVIPTHCTGRKAIMFMEKEMPNQFILNMSGTRLTFMA
jgi:7,8-dihydropterin-6-yl-methyl-4-(beta-D-ribofuranosyl)aminobenzene 5'-phosphate synthase